jgi:hypothetical protein
MDSPREDKVGGPSLTKFPLRQLTKKREGRKLARGPMYIGRARELRPSFWARYKQLSAVGLVYLPTAQASFHAS